MIKNERQQHILNILQQTNYISVEQLIKLTYSSPATIRRDLIYLQEQGYVTRSHGAVMLPQAPSAFIPAAFRKSLNYKHKKAICKVAAKLLKDHMLIFIDESSTTQFLIEHMKDYKEITVITNSLPACELLNRYNINFYCTGGHITHSNCFTGSQTEKFIRRFNADLCFFSSHAISKNGVITDNSESECFITSAMIEHSKKSIYLCDESKVGHSSIYNLANINTVNKIFTTATPDMFDFNIENAKKMIYVSLHQ